MTTAGRQHKCKREKEEEKGRLRQGKKEPKDYCSLKN